jgi:ubiquinone/menaquinone biosynthesis C-methylase UbiE
VPSIAFDRAAEYYDSTRGFGPGVAECIRDAIVAYTGAGTQTRFLELGVGTGRIALPFIRAGYDYTGVDLSQPMMDQLALKLADDPHAQAYHYRLLRADITDLPFADASFDVAITVHVLHLVDGWQRALQEARRVLRTPGGWLLIARDAPADMATPSATRQVNAQWSAILKELGASRDLLLPGIKQSNRMHSDELLEAYLRELGAQTQVVTLAEHETPPLSPRAMAQRHIDRLYSSDWQLGDELHAEAVRRLQIWLDTECSEPDRPISGTAQFKAITAHW